MEDGRIADDQITASSSISYRPAHDARLDSTTSVWAPKYLNNQWLQVDMRKMVEIHAIATQGHFSLPRWVKTYTLQYSNDGLVYTDYKDGRIFNGNTFEKKAVKHILDPPIKARYIKVLPKSFQRWIILRIELYGCE